MATAAEVRGAFRTYLAGDFPAADYPDATVDPWIQLALEIHASSAPAAAYLTAHLLKLEADEAREPDDGAGAGLIVGDRVGPLGVQYKQGEIDGGAAWYERTHYGRLFLALERRNPANAMTIRVYG